MADEAPEGWLCGLIFGVEYPSAAAEILRHVDKEVKQELRQKARTLRNGMRLT